jgi:hypothetical protein
MVQAFVPGLLRRLGEAVFGPDDARAVDRGWQVTVGRRGLSRTYRHPGFDWLVRCPDCQGSGLRRDVACGRCSGTGRVRLVGPVAARRS